jgi:hypothetical protein
MPDGTTYTPELVKDIKPISETQGTTNAIEPVDQIRSQRKFEAQKNMREIGRQNGLEQELRLNIREDQRFQTMAAQQRDESQVLDAFRQKFPKEYELYEKYGVSFNDQGEPDVNQDLFYEKLYREVEQEQKQRLLALKAQHTDPEAQLDTMGSAHSRIHFEIIRDKYEAYRNKFPEKSSVYATVAKNKHMVYFDEYAEQRLKPQHIPTTWEELHQALYKGVPLEVFNKAMENIYGTSGAKFAGELQQAIVLKSLGTSSPEITIQTEQKPDQETKITEANTTEKKTEADTTEPTQLTKERQELITYLQKYANAFNTETLLKHLRIGVEDIQAIIKYLSLEKKQESTEKTNETNNLLASLQVLLTTVAEQNSN